MAQMQVFVSHNHSDLAFCQAIVQALRDAGADVWLDESDLGAGHVRRVIMQELVKRPVFIVVLSKAALASKWVLDECDWAYDLQQDEPGRILLPVVAEPLERADFNAALHLYGLKRIEAPGMQPYPTQEAIRRLLHTLALTPANEVPAPTAPQPTESAADLLERGKALKAQQRYSEALPLFERATQLDPRSSDAWANLGDVLDDLRRYDEALTAYDRALGLDLKWSWVWNLKGITLKKLKRHEEALAAYDRALALAPNYAIAWNNKGNALRSLKRDDEALVAYDRALALDPNYAIAWNGKGNALRDLKRYDEALVAYDRALALNPNYAMAWRNKGLTLNDTQRYQDALNAYERSLTLEPGSARGWGGKALALRGLNRTAEAEAAERRAKELGG